MTDKGKQQLKNIIIETLSEFFEDSGINKILLSLYESKTTSIRAKTPTNKVSSILENNGKIAQLRKMQMTNYGDGEIDLPSMGVQGTKISPNLRVALNEHIDPLETGESVLDHVDSLPNFLTRGLAKIKKNATN